MRLDRFMKKPNKTRFLDKTPLIYDEIIKINNNSKYDRKKSTLRRKSINYISK